MARRFQITVASAIFALLAGSPAPAHIQKIEARDNATVVVGNMTNSSIGVSGAQLQAIIRDVKKPFQQRDAELTRKLEILQRRLGENDVAMRAMLRFIGRADDVPEEKLADALIDARATFHRLEPEVAAIPKNAEVRIPAVTALEDGDFGRVANFVQANALWKSVAATATFQREGDLAIVFTNGWDTANLTTIQIPELAELHTRSPQDFPPSGTIDFNKHAAGNLKAAFSALKSAGLLTEVKQWCGSVVKRLLVPAAGVSSGIISSHALGLAFDINCKTQPDSDAAPGLSPRQLAMVQIFQKHGFLLSSANSRLRRTFHFQASRFDDEDTTSR